MVEAPRNARGSKAPTNREVLFSLLTITQKRVNIEEAASTVVRESVIPFYQSASMSTIHVKTMIRRALAIYKLYKCLVKLKRRPPANFKIRTESFLTSLDHVFDVEPSAPQQLSSQSVQQTQFSALKVHGTESEREGERERESE